jgi:hypothetical protein
MGKAGLVAGVAAVWFAAAPAAQAGTAFDGQWALNIVCPAYQDAKGYAFHFTILIQNGQVQADYGTPGTPGYLNMSGSVADDGTIQLAGTQLTKNPDYSVGHVAPGTKIPFTVDGTMSGDTGQGTRTQTRPCTFYFNKAAY